MASESTDGASDETGLPRDINHTVPVLVSDMVVCRVPFPVGTHEGRAAGNLTRLTSGKASHQVTSFQPGAGDLAAEPRRPAEHQNLHGATQTGLHRACHPWRRG